MQNPDLIPVGNAPNTPPAVPPLVAHTPPLPNAKAAMIKHYFCTVPAASMHRSDGKRLPFIFGYLATEQLYDQQYLDNEIAGGNMYLREATEQEIYVAEMRIDPRGTIEKEMRTKLAHDPEFKKQVEDSLRAELEAKIRAELAAAGGAVDTNLGGPQPGSPEAAAADAVKLAGSDTQARAKAVLAARDAAAKTAVTGTGATVTLTGPAVVPAPTAPLMAAQVPPISPVSTATIAGAAVDSNQK